MNRIDLSAKLREIRIMARYDELNAIRELCELIKELNDEIEELKQKK